MELNRAKAIKLVLEKLSSDAPYKYDEKTILQLFSTLHIYNDEIENARGLK